MTACISTEKLKLSNKQGLKKFTLTDEVCLGKIATKKEEVTCHVKGINTWVRKVQQDCLGFGHFGNSGTDIALVKYVMHMPSKNIGLTNTEQSFEPLL